MANANLHILYDRYLTLLPSAPNLVDYTLIVRLFPYDSTRLLGSSHNAEYAFNSVCARMLRNRYEEAMRRMKQEKKKWECLWLELLVMDYCYRFKGIYEAWCGGVL
jgi:hypothetical protein